MQEKDRGETNLLKVTLLKCSLLHSHSLIMKLKDFLPHNEPFSIPKNASMLHSPHLVIGKSSFGSIPLKASDLTESVH